MFRNNQPWISGMLIWGLVSLAFPPTLFSEIAQPEVHETIDFTSTEISMRKISLTVDASKVISFDRPIVRTAVGNTTVADVVVINQREILLVANQPGTTSLMIWEAGGINQAFQVIVKQDPHVLKEAIHSTYPESHVEVHALGETYALTGEVDSLEERIRMMALAESFSPGAVDMLTIREPKQILIDVYFVELDLTKSKDFGNSFSYFHKNVVFHNFSGNVSGQTTQDEAFPLEDTDISSEPITGSGSEQIRLGYSDLDHFFGPVLESVETNNFLRVLARPKLLAKDGEEAEFLVGGSFPFATATSDALQIQWRDFGTHLVFTPEILDDGRIRLTIDTEITELNFSTTITISGATVPAFTENSARTVVELYDRQTLVIGGFISTRTTDVSTKVPILGDIPYIGKTFRSEDKDKREHELMFIITPHIVEPLELEGADKAGEFYDVEDIERVLHIDELPDPSFQADALGGALKNFEANRLLSEAYPERLPQAEVQNEDVLNAVERKSGTQEDVAAKLFDEAELLDRTSSDESREADTARTSVESLSRAESMGRYDADRLILPVTPLAAGKLPVEQRTLESYPELNHPLSPPVVGISYETPAPVQNPVDVSDVPPMELEPTSLKNLSDHLQTRHYSIIEPAPAALPKEQIVVRDRHDLSEMYADEVNDVDKHNGQESGNGGSNKEAVQAAAPVVVPAASERVATQTPSETAVGFENIQPVVRPASFSMPVAHVGDHPMVNPETLAANEPILPPPEATFTERTPMKLIETIPNERVAPIRIYQDIEPAEVEKREQHEFPSYSERHYRSARSYPAEQFRASILNSQRQTPSQQTQEIRHYRVISAAIKEQADKGEARSAGNGETKTIVSETAQPIVKSAEFITQEARAVGKSSEPFSEPQPSPGGRAYDTGLRNYRMANPYWGPQEWKQFQREQERIDQFFGQLHKERGV